MSSCFCKGGTLNKLQITLANQAMAARRSLCSAVFWRPVGLSESCLQAVQEKDRLNAEFGTEQLLRKRQAAELQLTSLDCSNHVL